MTTFDDFNPEYARLFFYYVLNRHKIQMKKDNKEPYPWTEDTILRDNSFTCNRRMDDRTTKWLLTNISYNNSFDINQKFWRSLIFRSYNKIETGELLELTSDNFWERTEELAERLDNHPKDPYTRAYTTRWTKYFYMKEFPDKPWKSTFFRHLVKEAKSFDYKIPEDCLKSPKDCYDWFRQFGGVGDFLGYQFLLDTMYIPEYPYDINSNTFVIAGPGAQRGLEFIMKSSVKFSSSELLGFIKENFEDLCRKFYDPEFSLESIRKDLNDPYAYCISDVQNLFCEFSKFCYMKQGTYRSRRGKYHPYEIQ